MELECKASGSPPPEILWFTGSGSNEQVNITDKCNFTLYIVSKRKKKDINS